jgi:hypothetical protein
MPIIPVLGKMRQDDGEFYANLGYIVRLYLKKSLRTRKQNTHTYKS